MYSARPMSAAAAAASASLPSFTRKSGSRRNLCLFLTSHAELQQPTQKATGVTRHAMHIPMLAVRRVGPQTRSRSVLLIRPALQRGAGAERVHLSSGSERRL